MPDQPYIMDTIAIDMYIQLSFNRLHQLRYQLRVLRYISDIHIRNSTVYVQCDKANLTFRQMYIQRLVNKIDDLCSDFIFKRIKSFRLSQERIFTRHPFKQPINRKYHMVCQCYMNTFKIG